MPVEGEVRVNPANPAQKARWTGGRWVAETAPGGGKLRPDYGPGAYETADGAIVKPTKSGGVQMLRGAQGATGEARTRLALGLGPAATAERNLMEATVVATKNPLNSGRAVLGDLMMGKGDNGSWNDALGKVVGGDGFQKTLQASKTFESAFLPILSGAAVTPQEAQRLIKASLPQMGDSPEILRRKQINRQMMINGAARLAGAPLPFPRVAAMDFTPKEATQAEPEAAPAGEWRIVR